MAVESNLVRFQETLAKAVLKFRTQYLPRVCTETVVEFTDKKAWKMAEVGNKPELRRR